MSELREFASQLGIELSPWQVEVGERMLAGDDEALPGGRRVGRATLRRVVRECVAAPNQSDGDS